MSEKDASSPVNSNGVDLAYEQHRILLGSAKAAVVCAVVMVGACYLLPRFFAPPEWLAERIAFALQADVFVLMWLVIGARMVSSGRFRSAADNRGSAFSAPSPDLAIKVAFLQNTLEQATMAVGIHLALASVLTGPALFSIPAAVALFGMGRVAFLKGYPKGAAARSFGMATTAIPTAVAFVWTIGLVVLNVFG